jgi:glycosyltransferase involved in cell wall biosynthesis
MTVAPRDCRRIVTKITAMLVSIVLPVYQPHERFFREAVASVLAQTMPDFELIIVEDPSETSAEALLRGTEDRRIRHVVNPRRTSLPEQHNLGLSLSRGAFICRFDADDLCEPERLAREIDFLRRHPEISVVSSALRIIDEEGRSAGVRIYPETHAEIRRTFPFANPVANSAVMFRREVYERFGGWRTDSALPAQDYEWYSRLAASGVLFANLKEPLVRYRLHAKSIKSTSVRSTISSTLETKQRYWVAEMGWKGRAIMFAERVLLRLPAPLVLKGFKVIRYRPRRK